MGTKRLLCPCVLENGHILTRTRLSHEQRSQSTVADSAGSERHAGAAHWSIVRCEWSQAAFAATWLELARSDSLE